MSLLVILGLLLAVVGVFVVAASALHAGLFGVIVGMVVTVFGVWLAWGGEVRP